jgi:crossover junction endodeoxyribonuclease RusA
MEQPITFFVKGEPRAKQSFRSTGRGRGFTPAYIKAWQSDVGWIAQQHMRALGLIEPIRGNLTVEITFFLGNHRRIDTDNLSKAIQDGLNGVVWVDDQQNIRLVLDKYICRQRQGVLVKIYPNHRPLEITAEQMSSFGCS